MSGRVVSFRDCNPATTLAAAGIDTDAHRTCIADPDFGPITPGLSQALRCGGFIFLDGQVSLDARGEVIDPDVIAFKAD